MNKEVIQESIKAIKQLKKDQVTLENEYFADNGLVCFNGAIHRAIYGDDARWSSGVVFDLNNDLGEGLKFAINTVHGNYCDGTINFSTAKKQVLKLLKSFI